MKRNIMSLRNGSMFFALVCVLWTYDSLIRYVSIALGRIPIVGDLLKAYVPITLLIILIICSIPEIAQYTSLPDIIICLAMALASVLALINGEKCYAFTSIAYQFLVKTLPLYFIGKTIAYTHNKDSNKDILVVLSMLCIWTTIIISFRRGFSFDAEWMSNQYTAYLMLPHVIIIMAQVFIKPKIVQIITLVSGSAYLVFLGNRGSIICFLVMFIILCIYKTAHLERNKRICVLSIVILACVAFVAFDLYHVLLYAAYNFAKTHGMSTRVFLFFLGDDTSVSLDSGRGTIIHNLLQAISNNFLGSGLTSDRYYSGGHYAHNLLIEILVEYGVIFGTLMIITLIVLLIRAMKYSHNNWNTGIFLYLLICCGFVKLLISGSYLTEPVFWTLLGFLVGINEIINSINIQSLNSAKYIRQ